MAKIGTKECLCLAKMLNTLDSKPELGIAKVCYTRIRSRVGPQTTLETRMVYTLLYGRRSSRTLK